VPDTQKETVRCPLVLGRVLVFPDVINFPLQALIHPGKWPIKHIKAD